MKSFIALFLAIALFSTACQKDENLVNLNNTDKPSPSNVVYTNTFESKTDSEGWICYGEIGFSEKRPANGGKYSGIFGGGCLQPMATKILTGLSQGSYQLSFDGLAFKNMSPGSVRMYTGKFSESSEYLEIQVNSVEWKHYSSSVVTVDASGMLTLEVYAGGIIMSEILLDNIKIERIDK